MAVDPDTKIIQGRIGECEIGEEDRLKIEVRVDQNENSPTVLRASK